MPGFITQDELQLEIMQILLKAEKQATRALRDVRQRVEDNGGPTAVFPGPQKARFLSMVQSLNAARKAIRDKAEDVDPPVDPPADPPGPGGGQP